VGRSRAVVHGRLRAVERGARAHHRRLAAVLHGRGEGAAGRAAEDLGAVDDGEPDQVHADRLALGVQLHARRRVRGVLDDAHVALVGALRDAHRLADEAGVAARARLGALWARLGRGRLAGGGAVLAGVAGGAVAGGAGRGRVHGRGEDARRHEAGREGAGGLLRTCWAASSSPTGGSCSGSCPAWSGCGSSPSPGALSRPLCAR